MGGKVSTDFKSSNRIEISRLVQVLLNFDWFWGFPPGGWGVDGDGGWWQGPPHMCTCTHVHAHARLRMHIWHHRESQGFPQIQWGRPFAWNYHVYHACTCVHVHACMHVHVHVCGGHPPTTPIHPAPRPAELQGAQNTKIQWVLN